MVFRNLQRNLSKRRNQGFTLIELLVVIAIIGLLAAVIISSLSVARARSRDARRKADINQFVKALELYYNINNAYPSTTGWVYSNDSPSWSALGTTMSSVLNRMPIDPNQSSSGIVYSDPTVYSYAYFSANFGNCGAGQWYVLVYKLERADANLPTSGYDCVNPPDLLNYTSGGLNYVYVGKGR